MMPVSVPSTCCRGAKVRARSSAGIIYAMAALVLMEHSMRS